MKWMPKWIGKTYSQLWTIYKENVFNFDNAEKLLGKFTPNYLSEMKRAQALFIFERKARKRIYRLVSPNLFTYSLTNKIDLGWLKTGAYANLILKFFFVLKERLDKNILALGVYGSVARNTAKRDSDLDLFIICQDLPVNLGDRLDLLREIRKSNIIQDELDFLNKKNYFPRFSFYPRVVSELRMNFFTIDIAFDMKTIYDTNILKNFLVDIKKRVEEQGIQRKYLDKERYYLDLNIKFGEAYKF